MSSDRSQRSPLALRIAAVAGLVYLHLPLLLIFLYAFTTEDKSFQFPPPGYTARWFPVAWYERPDIWPPLVLSLKVAACATMLAIIFGTLAAAAAYLDDARQVGKRLAQDPEDGILVAFASLGEGQHGVPLRGPGAIVASARPGAG